MKPDHRTAMDSKQEHPRRSEELAPIGYIIIWYKTVYSMKCGLFLIFCLTFALPIEGRVNLALNKTTAQKTTLGNKHAGRAVDGNTGGNINFAGCAKNDNYIEEQSWWIVDLEDTYIIDSVRIYTRSERCCNKRFRELQIQAIHEDGETIEVCKTIIPLVPHEGITYLCDKPVTGRFVRLIKIKSIERQFTICEFQVFGQKTTEGQMKRENYAFVKPLEHSGMDNKSRGNDSSLVDGVYFKQGFFKKCFMLERDTKVQWIIIDLQKTVLVEMIKIIPSYQGERIREESFDLTDTLLGVTMEDPKKLPGFPDKMDYTYSCNNVTTIKMNGLPFPVKCSEPLHGRYVWIMRKVSTLVWRLLNPASLCEIEVYGNSSSAEKSKDIPIDSSVVTYTHRDSIAWKKPTAQISTEKCNYAQRAVDGRTSGNINLHKRDAGCSQSLLIGLHQRWWIVDLEGIYIIDAVRIYSRSDCCTDRLREIDVQVIQEDAETVELCKRIMEFVPKGGTTYACEKPMIGRFVRVMQINKVQRPLTLCEVQVFGVKNADQGVEGNSNLAFIKPVRHSAMEIKSGFNVSGLVDGIYFASVKPNFCLMLSGGISHVQWVVIDLGKVASVDTIRITPAFPGCNNDRFELDHFSLGVSIENPETMSGFPKDLKTSSICKNVSKIITRGLPFPVKCTKPLKGRYVWLVRKLEDATLNLEPASICEIEVFGEWVSVDKGTVIDMDKERTWRFKLVGVKGDMALLNHQKSRNHQSMCARKRLEDKKVMFSVPFVLTNHITGDCQFFSSITDASQSDVEHYSLYVLE